MSNYGYADPALNGVGEESRFKVCPACDGDGFEDEYEGTLCRRCGGTGEIPLL